MTEIQNAIPIDTSNNNDPIIIETYDLELVKIIKLSKSVIIFSAIDFFFNFLYLIYNKKYLFPILCSCFGFYGAKYYKMFSLYVYLSFNILFGFGKLITIFLYKFDSFVIISIISGLIQLYIARFTFKLISKLGNISQDQLDRLKSLNVSNYTIVYW